MFGRAHWQWGFAMLIGPVNLKARDTLAGAAFGFGWVGSGTCHGAEGWGFGLTWVLLGSFSIILGSGLFGIGMVGWGSI